MQTKQHVLSSARAKQTYEFFYRKGIPAVVCRGTSGDEINFHYTPAPFWSDMCVGWVRQTHDGSNICKYCQLATPPDNNYGIVKEKFEEEYESRDPNCISGRVDVPDSPRSSELRQIHDRKKHRSEANESASNKTKGKKSKSGGKK